jgi:hypothetical protein
MKSLKELKSKKMGHTNIMKRQTKKAIVLQTKSNALDRVSWHGSTKKREPNKHIKTNISPGLNSHLYTDKKHP